MSVTVGQFFNASRSSNLECFDSSLFSRGLAIACLDINSLFEHIDELKIFTGNSKIDILSINETKVDSSISQH